MGNTIPDADREAMKSRIADWLRQENFDWARGKTRLEIFAKFGNEPQPIAYIPKQYSSIGRQHCRQQGLQRQGVFY